MSLAQSLLDDLASSDEEEAGAETGGMQDIDEKRLASVDHMQRPNELTPEDITLLKLKNIDDVRTLIKMTLPGHLDEIQNKIQQSSSVIVNTNDKEYQLVVQANHNLVQIENELMIIYRYLVEHYGPRFPELSGILTNPTSYVSAIKAIGNTGTLQKLSVPLKGVLKPAEIMIVETTASTSHGRPLSDHEWSRVEIALDQDTRLVEIKNELTSFVEMRLSLLAPNLSTLIGTSTTAKLLGAAGSLKALVAIPADHLVVLGSQTTTSIGLSTTSADRHTGFIYASELAQAMPKQHRVKVQRNIAAQCALAARIDLQRSSPDGTFGLQLREKVMKRMDHLQAPLQALAVKALPVPGEIKKARRGGRRARALKAPMQQTYAMKLRNQIAFGEATEEIGSFDETISLGMLGSASGKLRIAAEAKSNAKMSKKNKLRTAAISKSAAEAGHTGLPAPEAISIAISLNKTPDSVQSKWFKT